MGAMTTMDKIDTAAPHRTAGVHAGTRPRAIAFVDLVFESEACAAGQIASVDPPGPTGVPQRLILDVAKSFPKKLPGRIRVLLPDGVTTETFRAGEKCLLFLTEVTEPHSTLFGYGDAGKWPRVQADWVFTAGHVQPLEQVIRVAEGLLAIDAMVRYEDRVTALSRPPFVGNPLGQIAALQFAGKTEHWPQDRMQGTVSFRTVRQLLAGRTLLEKDPLDLAAEVALLELLEDVPPSASLPYLIKSLGNPDVALRDTAFAALQSTPYDIPLDGFGYNARAAETSRQDAVLRWQEWYETREAGFLEKDVPPFLEGLRSNALLERTAADLLLRVVSGEDVRFIPNDSPENRNTAVRRWVEWWEKKKKSQ